MQKIRVLGASIALGGVALLTGCVAVPGDPYYSGGYSDPYYSDPVVVQPAPVYIQGGGYYDGGRYYDRRPYYGRPGYPGVRPGYPAVRPGGPRPGWGGGGRPPGGGAIVPPTGNTGVSPLPQYRPQQPRGAARLWSSPDSKNNPGGIP
ncbi:hypothetical protein [Variovorax paradoxus]|uniref:Conserved hypothetical membrane spanning protein n=1 Tax=Variovorax paradoxus (strain EPS) TaxID=595537 RepID=E6VA24_VARPE|nr:hypothetical protein [Variovorax paradoxus]ADU37408.1 conserved hypothetical membrane spanning protein [Variovorax paradoxus EPS]